MKNKEIARVFKLLAQLMELHNENPFKIKSYANAAFKIDKLDKTLSELNAEDIEKIDGIGKSIVAKIVELLSNGTIHDLNLLLEKTPEGVIEMLAIKGIGPKKVRTIWKELEVETIGELLYACNENRLISLNGFGEKTQAEAKKSIEFKISNKGKFHYAVAEEIALRLIDFVKQKLIKVSPFEMVKPLISLTGEIRRKCEIVERIDLLVASSETIDLTAFENKTNIPLNIISCDEKDFYLKLFETTGNKEHIEKLQITDYRLQINSEEEIYAANGLQFIVPELREGLNEIELARKNQLPKLVEMVDLKGILHIHTKYSDGINSLEEMTICAKELGCEYIGISDHSQTAVYAGGLKSEQIKSQHQEIDKLNAQLFPFKIFKGIEADILNDGSLDYDDEILKSFDFVIASVHSNLKMNKEKANERLLKAIENRHTTILGHPTGRLILSREGYPIDHKIIIDACAEHSVSIELNANPFRLDMDWRWINYAIEKGVKISINPDAHSKNGYADMYYGLCVARKGGLTKEMCFNAFSKEEMENYLNKRKRI